MKDAEIYNKFDKIGCLTFATVDRGIPQTRIAHLFAHDHEGLYFRTMKTKAFYEELKTNEHVSICGMFPNTSVSHNKEGMPGFEPGYTISATGDVKEIAFEILKEKAAEDERFIIGVKDIERYPAMTTFCLHRAWGEVFDFDFEMEHRPHKLLRTRFSFGGGRIPFKGVRITDDCIGCGECMENCSFKAVYQQDDAYCIDQTRCDVCGDCYMNCPATAIEIVIENPGTMAAAPGFNPGT
ncbi:MAG: pyridoxine-5-phosphate oxidase [Desulfobacteraceae bacterium]|nr:pyridoxine-5-phosphate oxidase [Desulfobacteraceae bacterium]